MTDITVLARLLDGAMRNIDLTINTPVVFSLKVGGATGVELNKAILESLIANNHTPMSDNQNIIAGAGLTGGGNGPVTTLNVVAGTGIRVNSDSVQVDETVVRVNGVNNFLANQSMGFNKITNLSDAKDLHDAVNLKQVSTMIDEKLVTGGRFLKIFLTEENIKNKFLTLPYPVIDTDSIVFNIIGGITQLYGEDFIATHDIIKWDNLGLDGFLEVNDLIIIKY
jgi:hypothetical protein